MEWSRLRLSCIRLWVGSYVLIPAHAVLEVGYAPIHMVGHELPDDGV